MLFLVLMITESHRCVAADSIDKGGSKFDVDLNVVGLRGRESSANVEAIDKTDRRDLQAVVKSIQQERTWKGRNSNGRVYIPYVFHPNAFDDVEISNILEAMQSLEDRTGCLKFIPQTLEQAHLYFRRQSQLTCSADVGMSNGPVYVNLGVPCMGKGIIVHEVMHALGFEHEHVRPDRQNYVAVIYENLSTPYYAHNFFVKNDAVTLSTPYEYASVMHYAVDAFAVDGKISIEPNSDLITDTSVIGQREDATELDIIKIKLLYQCNTQVRTYSQFEDSPCTGECQCREGDTGCGESDDACHGSLICSSNTCVVDPTAPPTPEVPPASPTRNMIWIDKAVDLCLELKNRDTTWGNDVWLNQCESTEETSQLWRLESDSFIKSGLDSSLCLVGFAGNTIAGTTLMIYECLFSDDRFMWDLNDDGSIRPRNNPDVCIQSVSENDSVGENLVLGECDSGFLEFNKYDVFLPCEDSTDRFTAIKPDGTILPNRNCAWVGSVTNSDNELWRCNFEGATENCPSTCDPSCSSPIFTETMLDAAVDKGNCQDFRGGYWYDQSGRNCNWYSAGRARCITYGDSGSSFGKVANGACCFCGGGSDSDIPEPSTPEDKFFIFPQTPCYDFPLWLDSTKDGCDWYDETKCALYGNSYTDEYNVGANQACCICGGGADYVSQSDDPNAEPECSDDPFGWRNDNGDDCKWYEEDDNCADYGDYVGIDGLTANDACCACGGGLDPADKFVDSNEPTSSPSTSPSSGPSSSPTESPTSSFDVVKQEQIDLWVSEIDAMSESYGFDVLETLVNATLIEPGPKYRGIAAKGVYIMAYVYDRLGREHSLEYSECEGPEAGLDDDAYGLCASRLLALEFCTNDPDCDEANFENVKQVIWKPRDAYFNTELATMAACMFGIEDNPFESFEGFLSEIDQYITLCESAIEAGNQGAPGYENITQAVVDLQGLLSLPTLDGTVLVDHPILGSYGENSYFIIDGIPSVRMYADTWLHFLDATLTPLNLFDLEIAKESFRTLFYHSGPDVALGQELWVSDFTVFRLLAYISFMFGQKGQNSELTNFESDLVLDFFELHEYPGTYVSFGLALAKTGVSDTAGFLAACDDLLGYVKAEDITSEALEEEATKYLIAYFLSLSTPSSCVDSTESVNGYDCLWVSQKPDTRCGLSAAGINAWESCPLTLCGNC